VGHKLAERRAHTARSRANTTSVPAQGSAGAGSPLASSSGASQGSARAEAPRAPEDGTKTAISAAVPAAERVAAARALRFGRRSVGIAALATVSVAALAVMSMTMGSPEETRAESVKRPAVARQEVVAPPDLGARPAERAAEAAPVPAGPFTTPVVNTEPVVIKEPVRRASSDLSDDDREASDRFSSDDDPEAGSRSQRRGAGGRQKAGQHKSKSKTGARSGTLRTTRHGSSTTPPRVLPLPQPSERQQRAKAAVSGQGEAEPLKLATDPYDR
jgi:hypothetical protein